MSAPDLEPVAWRHRFTVNGVEKWGYSTKKMWDDDLPLYPTLPAALAVPEVAALVEALRVIVAPQYGLQGIIEDGDNPEDRAEYYGRLVSRYQSVARSVLDKVDAIRAADPVTKSS